MLPVATGTFNHLGGGAGAPLQINPSTSIFVEDDPWKRNSNGAGAAITQPFVSPQISPENPYKTELCRKFEEFGVCMYGDNCQFAHGPEDLRKRGRHPKYKTRLCERFHKLGLCPYGNRCIFIHKTPETTIPSPSSSSSEPTRPVTLGYSISSLPSGGFYYPMVNFQRQAPLFTGSTGW